MKAACVYLEEHRGIAGSSRPNRLEYAENFIEKLKAKARKNNKPILLDMHLRENSQRFMEHLR